MKSPGVRPTLTLTFILARVRVPASGCPLSKSRLGPENWVDPPLEELPAGPEALPAGRTPWRLESGPAPHAAAEILIVLWSLSGSGSGKEGSLGVYGRESRPGQARFRSASLAHAHAHYWKTLGLSRS